MKPIVTYPLFLKNTFYTGLFLLMLTPNNLFSQQHKVKSLSLAASTKNNREKEKICTDAVSIYYYNSTIGFAIDKKGVIKKTMNGGSTWIVVNTKSNQTIRSIHFPVANVGYAVGDSGTILKTKNGGKEWTKLASLTTKSLYSVYFSDIHQGYVIGQSGTILKTTDGGETWKHLGTNCSLSSAPEGTTWSLNKIYFDKSKYDLLSTSFPELDTLAKLLTENPTIQFAIIGHTDNHGDKDANLKLSVNRAKAVKEYLVSKQIDPERIKCKGYGESRPIASNDTEETMKLNRRVEFVILKR